MNLMLPLSVQDRQGCQHTRQRSVKVSEPVLLSRGSMGQSAPHMGASHQNF